MKAYLVPNHIITPVRHDEHILCVLSLPPGSYLSTISLNALGMVYFLSYLSYLEVWNGILKLLSKDE